MNIDELRSKIIQANDLYRNGNPIMSDSQFDDLVEQFQCLVSEKEYDEFRDSLHEVKGKIKHPFVMGSLNKLKIEEPENIISFIKTINDNINVSAKVDGISCRLNYKNGILTSASTRGDGKFGEDITDKIRFVKCIPSEIHIKDDIDIRGELVILKDDFADMTGFANPRNACAGIMNRKDFAENDVSKISFIAYTVLGEKFNKEEQFDILEKNRFTTAWHDIIFYDKIDYDNVVNELKTFAEQGFEYETDGLVICSCQYKNEDKYRPDFCKAVKINQLMAVTQITDIDWEGPSKNGYMIPVAQLEPVEIGGSMISRATLHNLDFISSNSIRYGSKVKILKSGDIIPKIVEVIDNSNSTEVEFPEVCPCCGSMLERDGVNLRCLNKKCKDQTTYQVMHFIRKLGVETVSFKTLQKFNIFTYDDLLSFKANSKYKSEKKLEDELNNKVLTRSKSELLASLNFNGLSETLLTQIIDFYGIDVVMRHGPFNGTPKGIGDVLMKKFEDDLDENINVVNKILSDVRYSFNENASKLITKKISDLNGMSVCFTGALSISRTTASKIAEDAGFEVKSGVSKGLTYLVTNTPNSGSSKNKKAQQLGTKIIDEKEFMRIINMNSIECGVDEI